MYASTKYSQLFDAIVRVSCIDGQEDSGELCSKLKEAEKSVAHAAIVLLANVIVDTLPAWGGIHIVGARHVRRSSGIARAAVLAVLAS